MSHQMCCLSDQICTMHAVLDMFGQTSTFLPGLDRLHVRSQSDVHMLASVLHLLAVVLKLFDVDEHCWSAKSRHQSWNIVSAKREHHFLDADRYHGTRGSAAVVTRACSY